VRSVGISFCILVARIALIVGFASLTDSAVGVAAVAGLIWILKGFWPRFRPQRYMGATMRLVIGVIAVLVLGSIFGSIAGLLFWPDLSSNLAHQNSAIY
jgi:uncharacterized membrane protein YphA (DoxX/SURF4 family)